MLRSMTMFALTATLAAGSAAVAEVPDYDTFTLHARSNLCVNTGGQPVFNLPCDTFFNSVTSVINDNGVVAAELTLVQGGDNAGLFYSTASSSSIVYITPTGGSTSDMSINSAGDVAFEQGFTSEDGIWVYDAQLGSASRVTTMPLGASDWGSPEINDNGHIGYRVSFSGPRAWVSFDGSSVAVHVGDSNVDINSDYSFLFSPTFNNARQLAGKLRVGPGTGGSQPDELRIFESDGSSTLIAEDQDGDAGSPYTSFDNSVALNNNGEVAFVATLPGNVRGVFLSDGTTTTTIATEGVGDVSDIEFFAPDVNDNGLVAFRGVDTSGLQAIFVGDGTTLRRMIGEHDLVEIDLGTARIDQNDSSPVFGGGVTINNHGAVVFNATLTPENDNQIEWGSGIFVSGIFGDINGDLKVNLFDLLDLIDNWGTDGPGADIAKPFDEVNLFDLLAMLDAWTG